MLWGWGWIGVFGCFGGCGGFDWLIVWLLLVLWLVLDSSFVGFVGAVVYFRLPTVCGLVWYSLLRVGLGSGV